jgi:hypothetical protein
MGGTGDGVLHEGEKLDYMAVDELELDGVGLELQQGAPGRMKGAVVACLRRGARRSQGTVVPVRVCLMFVPASCLLAGEQALSHGGTVPLLTGTDVTFGAVLVPYEAFILTRASRHTEFAPS